MAHFALLDENNFVVNVIAINDDVIREGEVAFSESEEIGKQFIANELGLSGEWVQTSYNGKFRGLYASGCRYDKELDMFVYPEEKNV